MAVSIAIETPLQDDVRGLVARLNDHLQPLSPPEFQFKMTVDQMAGADTTVFVARDESGKAIGMGALKLHSAELGEVKRMFTDAEVRGKRVGSALLEAIVGLARQKNLSTVVLETGTGEGMAEAHRLYTRSGFVTRGAFLDYPASEWSAFFEMPLNQEQPA
ncbi:GNAT family N-acetyltransferase [Devosia psychrophila]|uniref:Acetyltransferase n=1 Tax=Devosia psychrophila TaxID=728005 RepID=A0A0F5Q290_9HYPH|nr:GNAT family N-acetyltransferase [Devosia psychrophila]KKC34741.1 acetyltransferase [Devosia psychrophila]SFC06478.1 putative acetyltransferase [Devosia psychrophila]